MEEQRKIKGQRLSSNDKPELNTRKVSWNQEHDSHGYWNHMQMGGVDG